jgi:septum formation protein
MISPSLWTDSHPLLLASTSAIRRALLESAGLIVDTEASGVDERAVEAAARGESLDPSGVAMRLATEKAVVVSRRHPSRIVVGADQILEFNGEIMHKAIDRRGALDKLLLLAGRTHMLRASGAVAQDGRIIETFVDSASLTMRPLDVEAVERYCDLAGPDILHSVGCYQLEGLGVHLFESLEGNHATILGLPLIPLLAILRRLGCLAF